MKVSHSHFTIMFLTNIFQFSRSEMEKKIVGGDFAEADRFPHAVFLNIRLDSGLSYICGGSILNQRIILTAAHCVVDFNYKKGDDIQAFAGTIDYTRESTVRSVRNTKVHEDYDEDTVQNDVAIAEVSIAFPLNRQIKRVIISRRFPKDNEATVAGWGMVDEDEPSKHLPQLKFAKQRLVSRAFCNEYINLAPGMLCAGSTDETVDHPAAGDSGSGLLTSGYVAIGLVSYREGDYPALIVYSNTSYFYNWIERKVKEMLCPP